MKKSKSILVLGINGSPRKNSNTAKLLARALSGAKKEGAKTITTHLIDKNIEPCLGCYSTNPKFCGYPCNQKDDMQEIYKLIIEADGLILGSPTYWYNVSGIMKNFIDRLTALEESDLLKGKIGGAIVTAVNTGGEEVSGYLLTVLNEMGFFIPPFSTVYYNSSSDKFSSLSRDATSLGQNIVNLARLCRNKKVKWVYTYKA